MAHDRIIYVCPHCGSSKVQSTAWVSWDVDKQDWVIDNDEPPCSDDYCAACETHVRSLNVVAAPNHYVVEAYSQKYPDAPMYREQYSSIETAMERIEKHVAGIARFRDHMPNTYWRLTPN